MQEIFKRFVQTNLDNLKSSPKFGKDEVVSKNLNNLRKLLKERRFLYFTKKGPIEIVFNIKHYLTACAVALIFLFKLFQYIFFGISSFFNYAIYTNSQINSKQFTETEIEALKNIAKDVLHSDNSMIDIQEDFEISELQETEIEESFEQQEIIIEKNNDLATQIKEKFTNIRSLLPKFNLNSPKDFNYSDEIIFDQFANLASPEMVAIEHTLEKSSIEDKKKILKKDNVFSYRALPVVPFTAPRTNKLKIVNFTKKLDREILQLVNVFRTLNLTPDDMKIIEIERLTKEFSGSLSDQDLIESTSLRFQYLEDLKNAIVYLPLKPPMQYYYVSSPYGLRIHPKTKKKQMHHGIDMAGTWQEEVRASADGYVAFSGRNGGFGKAVKIVHKHGVTTLYGHLHRLNVKKGEFVKEGQIIGKMGATGRAVGAHLHYEIKVNKKPVDPYKFISIGRELLSSSILKN